MSESDAYLSLAAEIEAGIPFRSSPYERLHACASAIQVYLRAFHLNAHDAARQLDIGRHMDRMEGLRDAIVAEHCTPTSLTVDLLVGLSADLAVFEREYDVVLDYFSHNMDELDKGDANFIAHGLDILGDAIRFVEPLMEHADVYGPDVRKHMHSLRIIESWLLYPQRATMR